MPEVAIGPAFALGLRLAGNGALHVLGKVHLLHFHFGDLDAPRFGLFIQDGLQTRV